MKNYAQIIETHIIYILNKEHTYIGYTRYKRNVDNIIVIDPARKKLTNPARCIAKAYVF